MAASKGSEEAEMYKTTPGIIGKGGTQEKWIFGDGYRKHAETTRHISAQNLIKAHYTRISTARSFKPKTTGLIIPAKHRRAQTDDYEPMRRSHSKSQSTFTPLPCASPVPPLTLPTAATPEGTKTVRFKLDDDSKSVKRTQSDGQLLSLSSRLSLSKKDNLRGIKEICRVTHSGVKREKRVVRLKRRRFLRGLKQCSTAIDRALKVDVVGYIPQPLLEYKRKKAEERAARGIVLRKPPPVYLQKEVVVEYRRDLLHKALKHNIDKDMRYIYTLGSCSTNNT